MLHSISQHTSHEQRRSETMHLSPTDTNVQSRSRTSFTVSMSTMGWASMLLLASTASAFNADVMRISRIPVPEVPSAVGLLATVPVASTRRQYRNRNGFRAAAGMPKDTRSNSMTFSTRLQYRDADEDESDQRRLDNDNAASKLSGTGGMARWWNAVVQSTVKEDPNDERQRRVDDYLEFLDKRYNRLHSDEKVDNKKTGFSVVGWLMDQSADNDQDALERQKEDALHVLGVAELASERLLQKHQLATQKISSESLRAKHQAKPEDVIDATVIDKVKSHQQSAVRPVVPAKSTIMLSGMVEAGAVVLRGLQLRRSMLIRYQRKRLQAALMLIMKTLAKTPKTAASLWKLGGGTRTLAVTASAAAAIFLVVRPVIQGMIYEAAYRG